ncbi:hypothetical protein BpHYR1_009385, partial [Brachionus plicatilis]
SKDKICSRAFFSKEFFNQIKTVLNPLDLLTVIESDSESIIELQDALDVPRETNINFAGEKLIDELKDTNKILNKELENMRQKNNYLKSEIENFIENPRFVRNKRSTGMVCLEDEKKLTFEKN